MFVLPRSCASPRTSSLTLQSAPSPEDLPPATPPATPAPPATPFPASPDALAFVTTLLQATTAHPFQILPGPALPGTLPRADHQELLRLAAQAASVASAAFQNLSAALALNQKEPALTFTAVPVKKECIDVDQWVSEKAIQEAREKAEEEEAKREEGKQLARDAAEEEFQKSLPGLQNRLWLLQEGL